MSQEDEEVLQLLQDCIENKRHGLSSPNTIKLLNIVLNNPEQATHDGGGLGFSDSSTAGKPSRMKRFGGRSGS